ASEIFLGICDFSVLGMIAARWPGNRGLAFSRHVLVHAHAVLRPGSEHIRAHSEDTGSIEAAICAGIARFEQEYMGRGPKDIHAHLIGEMLLIRLEGVLTAAEQQLVKTLEPERGRDLLKQVRTQLIETARPTLEAVIQEITGVKVVSLHHDISTATGEEVI